MLIAFTFEFPSKKLRHTNTDDDNETRTAEARALFASHPLQARPVAGYV